MSDQLVAWIKDQVRKSQIKELIKAHTGLTPPAFMAVVALAAAGTALTVSAVSSFLAPPKQNEKSYDEIIDNEIMPFSPQSNQRELNDPISVFLEATKEEEEEEEVAEEAAVVVEEEEVEEAAVVVEEEAVVVEAPAKEQTVTAPIAPTEAAAAAAVEAVVVDGDNINSSSSEDDDFAEAMGA